MLELVLSYYDVAKAALDKGADMDDLFTISARDRIARAKACPQDQVDETFASITAQLKSEAAALVAEAAKEAM